MIRQLKRMFKQHLPSLYGTIFTLLLPIYDWYHAIKVDQFTKRTVRTVTHAGIHFQVILDPENGFVDSAIFAHGVYEPEILDLIKKHLPVGGTFVDIGANIGQHSLFAAKITGNVGSVISFEPIPRLAHQIRESAVLNRAANIISVRECAASDRNAKATLQIRPENIGGSGFHHTTDSYEQIQVVTEPGDTVLASVERVDLIKIDTEGHELHAIRGLRQTLAKHRPTLIVEFSPVFWGESAKEMASEFFSLLRQFKYSCQDIENEYFTIEDTETWSGTFSRPQTNLLCIAL